MLRRISRGHLDSSPHHWIQEKSEMYHHMSTALVPHVGNDVQLGHWSWGDGNRNGGRSPYSKLIYLGAEITQQGSLRYDARGGTPMRQSARHYLCRVNSIGDGAKWARAYDDPTIKGMDLNSTGKQTFCSTIDCLIRLASINEQTTSHTLTNPSMLLSIALFVLYLSFFFFVRATQYDSGLHENTNRKKIILYTVVSVAIKSKEVDGNSIRKQRLEPTIGNYILECLFSDTIYVNRSVLKER